MEILVRLVRALLLRFLYSQPILLRFYQDELRIIRQVLGVLQLGQRRY